MSPKSGDMLPLDTDPNSSISSCNGKVLRSSRFQVGLSRPPANPIRISLNEASSIGSPRESSPHIRMESINGFRNLCGALHPSLWVHCFIFSSKKNKSPRPPFQSPTFQQLAAALNFTTSSGVNSCLMLVHAEPCNTASTLVESLKTFTSCISHVGTRAVCSSVTVSATFFSEQKVCVNWLRRTEILGQTTPRSSLKSPTHTLPNGRHWLGRHEPLDIH